VSEPKQKLTDIHPLSSTTTLIEICLTTKDEKLEEKKIGVGTGFFYTANSGEPYIITNRHNVAKKDAFIYPEHLWIEIKTHDVKELNEKGHPTCYERRAKLALYNLSSEANWFEHPIYREQVDVAAIPINTILGRLEKNELIAAINQYACFEEMYFDVGSEVFVIGYPLGLTAGKFPIWKRGSIASDVEVDLEGVPKMYVDTASRKGMSGAPVVVLRRGENLPKPQGAIFTSPID
jgi:hypothetical protein